jgi:hypothetical protein
MKKIKKFFKKCLTNNRIDAIIISESKEREETKMKRYEVRINNRTMVTTENKALADATAEWYAKEFADVTVEVVER